MSKWMCKKELGGVKEEREL